MGDCEWMYGDAATGAFGFAPMARFNPFRWSGSLTLNAAMKQLEDCTKDENAKTRPIVVKLPSGVTAKEHRLPDAAAAIQFLQDNDPVKIAAEKAKREAEEAAKAAAVAEAAEKRKLCQQAQDHAFIALDKAEQLFREIEENIENSKEQLKELNKNTEEVTLNKLKVQTTVQCDWMYSDAVTGAIATYNPLRWSGEQPLLKTLDEMTRDSLKNQQRSIRMKIILEDGKKEEETFKNSQEALDYLPTLCAALQEVEAARLKTTSDLAAEESRMDTLKADLQKARESVRNAQTVVNDAKEALAACSDTLMAELKAQDACSGGYAK